MFEKIFQLEEKVKKIGAREKFLTGKKLQKRDMTRFLN